MRERERREKIHEFTQCHGQKRAGVIKHAYMRLNDDNQVRINLPHTMSKVQSVTYGNTLNESLPSSFSSLFTRIALCSQKMSIKSSRILKWNAGVRIYDKGTLELFNARSLRSFTFLRWCHFCPKLVSRPVPSHGIRYE